MQRSATEEFRPGRVWYLAYGSNVNEARFLRYLVGDDSHVGARDATPPQGSRWTTAPLRLRFGHTSRRWGGGVAFVDPDPAAEAVVRAWDITSEQFEDVFAQENRRAVGSPLPWNDLRGGGGDGAASVDVAPSWYGRVHVVDVPFATRGQPALTFSWSAPQPTNPPTEAYRATIASGLRERGGWTDADIDAYLHAALTH